MTDAHVRLRAVGHTYPARAGHPAVQALAPIDLELKRGESVEPLATA